MHAKPQAAKYLLEKLFLALLIYNGVNQPPIETMDSERGEFFAQFKFDNDNILRDNLHTAFNSMLNYNYILFLHFYYITYLYHSFK